MKQYRVVYNYNGHILEAGQNGWISSKGIADRILDAKKSNPIYKDRVLYLEERDNPEAEEKPACRIYSGKEVINPEWLYCDALRVGDYVEAEIVVNFMDCLMPACMRSDCSQLGSPHSMRMDENGKVKDTFLTFKKVDRDTWEYCGDCFRGENTMRGTPLPWI